MIFSYDPAKSAANREKHGIDFERAQALWDDERMYVVATTHPLETRFMSVGMIDDRLWAAIWTRRDDTIRLISVRRARDKERDAYGHA